MEDRERSIQHAEEPRLSPGAQLRHGKKYLWEAFFLLGLVAFVSRQVHELVDEIHQEARALFSARREYWNAIRVLFRFALFDSWDQLFARVTGPPHGSPAA